MSEKKPLSREAIRAIAIRNGVQRRQREADAKAAQGVLPGIVDETLAAPKRRVAKPMNPRLLAACVASAGFERNDQYADAA